MKPIRVFAALAALLIASGLLAACGSDDKEEYAQQVEEILDPLGNDLQQLGAELSGATDESELASGLEQAEGDLQQAADEIEALDVPDGVEQVNSDLVTAINGFADELGTVREAAESGNAEALQKSALNLPQVASDFEDELNRIQQDAIDAGVPIEQPDTTSSG